MFYKSFQLPQKSFNSIIVINYVGDSRKLKEALGACKNSVVLFSNLDILRYPKNIHIENLRVH